MRKLVSSLAMLPLLALALPGTAMSGEADRTFSARFAVTGDTSSDTSGTASVREGRPMTLASWNGGPNEATDSPGYHVTLNPVLQGDVLQVKVDGDLRDSYGKSVDGRENLLRSSFGATVSLERSAEGWVYEQPGLPGGRTMKVTFVQD